MPDYFSKVEIICKLKGLYMYLELATLIKFYNDNMCYNIDMPNAPWFTK